MRDAYDNVEREIIGCRTVVSLSTIVYELLPHSEYWFQKQRHEHCAPAYKHSGLSNFVLRLKLTSSEMLLQIGYLKKTNQQHVSSYRKQNTLLSKS